MSTCIVWRGGNQLRRQVVEKTSYCVLPTAGERKRKSVDHAGFQRFRVADSLARWARLLRRKSREGGRRDVTRMARSCYIGEKKKKKNRRNGRRLILASHLVRIGSRHHFYQPFSSNAASRFFLSYFFAEKKQLVRPWCPPSFSFPQLTFIKKRRKM